MPAVLVRAWDPLRAPQYSSSCHVYIVCFAVLFGTLRMRRWVVEDARNIVFKDELVGDGIIDILLPLRVGLTSS